MITTDLNWIRKLPEVGDPILRELEELEQEEMALIRRQARFALSVGELLLRVRALWEEDEIREVNPSV